LCILVRNNHITSLGIYLVLPADVACRECRYATSFDRNFHRRAWCGGLLLAQRGSGSDARLFAAACGSSGSREAAGTTRCRVGFFIDSFGPLSLVEYNRTSHD
jgi:hypothetical protein